MKLYLYNTPPDKKRGIYPIISDVGLKLGVYTPFIVIISQVI
jgi:hypothetical protein